MLSPGNLALALLPCITIMGLLAGNELGLRKEARTAAAKAGQSCVALSDPTAGANPMLEEHRLPRSVYADGESYFLSHQVLVTSLSGPIYKGDRIPRSVEKLPLQNVKGAPAKSPAHP